MRIKLLTYYNQPYSYSARLLIKTLRTIHPDALAIVKKNNDFNKTKFYGNHTSITKQQRGDGYWLWKPYYIYEQLQKLDEGETLVYSDAGICFVRPVTYLEQLLNKENNQRGVLLFHNYQGAGHLPAAIDRTEHNLYVECRKNMYWAKRDVFRLMKCDEPSYWNSLQVEASFALFRKTSFSLQFVEEWLHYCCNDQILTDAPNVCGYNNHEPFIMHIHDQAVLSLLAHKHAIGLYRCPSQFGNHMKSMILRDPDEFTLLPYYHTPEINSTFPTITNHHRTKRYPFPKHQLTIGRNLLSNFDNKYLGGVLHAVANREKVLKKH